MFVSVCIDIESMEVYVDGERVETVVSGNLQTPHCFLSFIPLQGEFTDNGCETHFNVVAGYSAFIKAVSSGHKVKGLVYTLVVLDTELKPVKEVHVQPPS